MDDAAMLNLVTELKNGLNGMPDDRAATQWLVGSCEGVWLSKLIGWKRYLGPLSSGGFTFFWDRLRVDLDKYDSALAAYREWAGSPEGQRAPDEQHAERLATTGPFPWMGVGTSEMLALRVALLLAPDGLLSDAVSHLDPWDHKALQGALGTLVAREQLPAGAAGGDSVVPPRRGVENALDYFQALGWQVVPNAGG